jgi:alpha-galactosidase
LRKSVMNTPLHLGDKTFERGLGTHSVSELVVNLKKPGGRFQAIVGVDNNYDTQGVRGSVEFVVEAAGKELFHSNVRRGSDPGLPVDVDLGEAKRFTLRVLDGGDGPAYDQSDWADAKVVQPDCTVWLDEMPVLTPPALDTAQPFSMQADGKPVTDWVRRSESVADKGGVRDSRVVYTSAANHLSATVDLRVYDSHPAADWVIHLKNDGSAPSPMITDLKSLDLALSLPVGDAAIHGINGSDCSTDDFVPFDDALTAQYDRTFAPNGGRSSDGVAPFFNVQWQGGGLVLAIGWSGEWSAQFTRADGAGRIRVGQQTTHFRLNPGEEIRTPRVVLLGWAGDDPIRGNNLFRRLMLDSYTAKSDGKPAITPICQNTWFACDSGNNVTEANQLAAIADMKKIGVEAYWLDAGWFIGGWPDGAGNWDPKPEAFPHGLKPLGDAAHDAGMKFVLWFEPERVTRTSPIFNHHREFVLENGGGDCLFDLGNPAARRFLTDMLVERIKKWGVDVYRNDFNIDPLRFWNSHDAPDRQGISEIRYIEGLYGMWDELRASCPGLTIDNCASGGRRIDIEMTSRSYPLWQSDFQCGVDCAPVPTQDQNSGLSLFVPVHCGGVWGFDPYSWRSMATAGAVLCNDEGGKRDKREARAKLIEETKRLRPSFLGDYYPLLSIAKDERQWCAWQYDRPDHGEGFVMAFRRKGSPYASVQLALRAIAPKATYEVEFVDLNRKETMTGAALASLTLKLDKPETSLLVIYRKRT